MAWVKYVSILMGLVLLVAALWPLGRIMAALPHGHLRRSWNGLRLLVFGFIAGYGAIAWLGAGRVVGSADLIVSAILLFGGLFVLLVVRLSDQTTGDVLKAAALEGELGRDALTGLYNRRHMERAMMQEVARARLSQRPLSILLIDIDHFKRINDTYGHLVGDMVLRHVADLLSRTVRSVDTTVRYGGEEFLVIAPGCDASHARELAGVILAALRACAIPLPDGQVLPVTASIGTAELTSGLASEEVIDRADRALYHAKRRGRDRVVAFCDALDLAAA